MTAGLESEREDALKRLEQREDEIRQLKIENEQMSLRKPVPVGGDEGVKNKIEEVR